MASVAAFPQGWQKIEDDIIEDAGHGQEMRKRKAEGEG